MAGQRAAFRAQTQTWAPYLVTTATFVVLVLLAPVLRLPTAAVPSVVFAAAIVIVSVTLSFASRDGRADLQSALIQLGIASGLILLSISLRQLPQLSGPWSATALNVVCVDLGLLAGASVIGGRLGRRVLHPGHLLPACAVAGAADIVSMTSSMGPSHAIAQSEQALALMAVSLPVPGTYEFAPVIGLGDLIFMALVFGVVEAHNLSRSRALAAGVAGLALAGALSAWLRVPVPALPTIGFAVVLILPQSRKLSAADRTVGFAAVAGSIVLSLVMLLLARANPN